jgi:hypothetical protein
MPQCMCPNCKTPFSARSSEFGENHRCAACGFEFKLDVAHLARYQLPNTIRIQLRDVQGNPFTQSSVAVFVSYGYRLPPLRSDQHGQVLLTKEMFEKAWQDEVSTGLMDHRGGDYSLNRFIHVKVPERNEASKLSNARAGSGWPILAFERELYGDMASLVAAYIPEENIVPVELNIDLSKANEIVDVELGIATL